MKRDLDLLRAILLHLFMFYPDNRNLTFDLDGYRQTQVEHHVRLLLESGLIFRVTSCPDGDHWDNLGLTNDGYDFVAMANNIVEWKEARDNVLVCTGGQNFGLVRKVLEQRARAKVGLIPR